MKVSGAEEVKRQIEAAKSPLNIWLTEIKETPLETKLRHHIYRLAHQAFLKGNLSEKDFIINELCKVLAPFGITKILDELFEDLGIVLEFGPKNVFHIMFRDAEA